MCFPTSEMLDKAYSCLDELYTVTNKTGLMILTMGSDDEMNSNNDTRVNHLPK